MQKWTYLGYYDASATYGPGAVYDASTGGVYFQGADGQWYDYNTWYASQNQQPQVKKYSPNAPTVDVLAIDEASPFSYCF